MNKYKSGLRAASVQETERIKAGLEGDMCSVPRRGETAADLDDLLFAGSDFHPSDR